jgi:hypothetical protein
MASEVLMANMAIGNVGSSQFINSLEDRSKEARVCKQFFDIAMDLVLQDFPWTFATKTVLLADIGAPIDPWQYRYAYPNDCLKLRRIFPPGGTIYLGRPSKNKGIPHRVITDDVAKVKAILCDAQGAYAEYTFRNRMPGMYSPAFIAAFAMKLATYICTPLSADLKYATLADQNYKKLLLEAAALDQSENQEDICNDDGDLNAARWE